jgi:DNA-binding PadR family transcriptional regulator
MPLPTLTHLQFFVLSTLAGDSQRSGHFIRTRFAEDAIPIGKPAFYQLMARMRCAGLIEGQLFGPVNGAQEAYYRATVAGRKAYDATAAFYRGYL